MASVAFGTNLTLAEMVRRQDPKHELADLIDTASKETPLLMDAKWTECNRTTMHECTRVATKPAGQDRLIGEGVSSEAGVTTPHTEPTQMLSSISEVPAKVYQYSPDGLAARLQEDDLFFRGMNETVESRFLTGNRASNPRQINGILNRPEYNSLTSPDSNQYVFDNADGQASATANKTYILLIQWGYKKINMLYPRNDPVEGMEYGIKMEDFGKTLQTDPAGTKKLPMWQTWFEINFGIFIWDPRCVKVIANISTTSIDGEADFGFDEDWLIRAYNSFKYGQGGIVGYCNETVLNQMWIRAKNKANLVTNFTEDADVFGRPIVKFLNVPFRKMDQIASDGATISA